MKLKPGQESVARANQLKRVLDLSRHPAFEKGHGYWDGSLTSYYVYVYLGQEVKLRYSQSSGFWTAICDELSIETSFRHETPQGITYVLDAWMGQNINLAQVELAKRHNVSAAEALVIYQERCSL